MDYNDHAKPLLSNRQNIFYIFCNIFYRSHWESHHWFTRAKKTSFQVCAYLLGAWKIRCIIYKRKQEASWIQVDDIELHYYSFQIATTTYWFETGMLIKGKSCGTNETIAQCPSWVFALSWVEWQLNLQTNPQFVSNL